jgi:single-strand DNA-binding protein
MLNNVQLIGNVGQDPEMREVNGTSVVNLSIATSEKYKDKSGAPQEKTEWHRVAFWGKAAEIIAQYVSKGSKLYVSGSIESRKYDKDGVEMTAYGIRGRDFKFLDTKGEGGSKPAPRSDSELNDDLPF